MFILCGFKNLGDVDVEISCLAQYVGHPLELGPDRLPPLILDNGLEQSDGGAEPSQGNPHLVDGISLGHVSNNGLVGHQVLQAGCADSLKGGGAGHLALEDHRRRFDACGSFLGGGVEAALGLGLEAQAQRRHCRDCQGEPKQIGRCALLELKLELENETVCPCPSTWLLSAATSMIDFSNERLCSIRSVFTRKTGSNRVAVIEEWLESGLLREGIVGVVAIDFVLPLVASQGDTLG